MMYVIDKKRFKQTMKEVRNVVLTIVAVIWFCVFIYQHSGLNLEMPKEELVREFVTYEYVVQESEGNSRIKEKVPVKVVHRYYE